MDLEGSMMYQEKETKYDGYAKKLFYDFRRGKKGKVPIWERLDFKDRDEWRGIAQTLKRERKELRKQEIEHGHKFTKSSQRFSVSQRK